MVKTSLRYAIIQKYPNFVLRLKKLIFDISQGYLKQITIHPNEGIIGYMNIKHKKGVHMTVNIPIEGQVYSFDWDVSKKKKQ